ncbi:MAG: ThuA domain-containing protein [Cyclobacteriaceae bacterium]
MQGRDNFIISKFRSLTISLKVLIAISFIGIISCSKKKSKVFDSSRIEILFLGHDSQHHDSERYMPILASALIDKGIHFTYTSDPNDLNKENLDKYDGLSLYANHDSISESQEKALLDFVESGKGFIPIHCASYCFRNSASFVDMVGGQFMKHDTATFTTTVTASGKQHPTDLSVFETWDETYMHDKINPNIDVLMERQEGDHKEPWTWTNKYGQGRIFYTAYGHDERTWMNPGFHELMNKGIKWAVGEGVANKVSNLEMPGRSYTEAKIPNYEKRNPPLKLQGALSPEESMKLTQVPVGFELQLFASEPDIINPIAMAWDEKGRLWVIETVDYPNTVRQEDGIGDDRIKICEDTDGDGKADKFTVFAEELNIPTSMVFANGGIIVSQAPHFLFLQDTDGDDKADIRKVINTGWGVSDTHAGPSNLKYGIDNKIWGTVGYSGYQNPDDGNHKFSNGLYRMNQDGSELEKMVSTTNNTWGLGFSEDFNVFASTANNTHSVFAGILNSYVDDVKGLPRNLGKKLDGHYAMHPITQQVRQVDVFGGFTAAAGHALYTARSFPKAYWNKIAFVCEPTGRLVHNAILKKDGAGFTEKDGWNLIASNDNWFAPVHAEVGPDGAVWIADWYNFIIQHNPTPPGFENGPGNAHINPLRDRQHGRIYRLAYKGAKEYDPISLSLEDEDMLVEYLNNENLFWRLTAQRLLIQRGEKDVLPALHSLLKSQETDELGLNPGALHALWVIHGLGAIHSETASDISNIIVKLLSHPSAAVRKAAVQILPKVDWGTEAILQSGILNDQDPNTRFEAILALSEMPSVAGIAVELLRLSHDESVYADDLLSKAVYIAAVNHKAAFLASLAENSDLNEKYRKELENFSSPYNVETDISNWGQVEVPANLESTEIGDVDGVFWYRKELQLTSPSAATIYLGVIRQSDELWVNGQKIGNTEGGWRTKRVYDIPDGVLVKGKNVIAVKVINTGSIGGFIGEPEDLVLEIGKRRISLAGQWSYQIEYIQSNLYFTKSNSIIRNLLINYELDVPEQENQEDKFENAKVITIKTIPNEMKYDLNTFEVEAGMPVEIRFSNNDFMQHNLLVLEQGSLETVGAAADKMATNQDGAANNYVPKIPEVLYSTKLVDPNTVVSLKFVVPKEPGEYPFVCTFPGHWRMMNGIMKVVAKEKKAI